VSDLAIGILIGIGIAGFLAVVGGFLVLVLQVKRTAAEVERFLVTTGDRIDRIAADVEEVKQRLVEPVAEGVERVGEAAAAFDGLGRSLTAAVDRISFRGSGSKSWIPDLVVPLLSLAGGYLGRRMTKTKDRRKGDE